MAIFLPDPLEDEPLFSVVGRYMHGMRAKTESVQRNLFGYLAHPSIYSYNLEHVSQATQACWGFSAETIAEKMTAYPYSAALLPPTDRDNFYNQILSRATRGLNKGRTLNSDGTGGKIQYCEACFSEDLKQGSPLHWRRVHQLPFVAICPWHGELLWVLEKVPLLRSGYFVPADRKVLGASRIALQLSPSQHDACLKLACLSLTLLTSRITVFPETFKANFDSFLKDYCERNRLRLTYSDCVEEMREYFGPEYFRWCGVRDSHNPANRVLLGYRRAAEPVIPQRMVMLATFCSGMDRRDLSGHRACRWVPGARTHRQPELFCISNAAAHGKNHLVTRTIWRDRRFRSTCNCGMSFTFEAWSGNMAINPKITRWGKETKELIAYLRSTGGTYSAIARHLGISHSQIYRIVHRLSNSRSAQDDS
ncbi:Homeodomain-like domain-containing protein [Burkholderia sp. D7]|nr:Homeodomain-like domain-containing protein [Burkholderia sp. D7]